MRTSQEILNQVVPALLAQGPSFNEDTRGCRYRSETGAKCAIGMLIKDENYRGTIEGDGIWSENVQDALAKSGVPFDTFKMLEDLQVAHDDALWTFTDGYRNDFKAAGWDERFKTAVQKLALKHSLISPV